MTQINQEKFNSHFKDYYDYCKRGSWLKYQEVYKFHFGRWINDRINFDTQTDQEILDICNESQQQYFDNSGSKGINFIISSKQYHDDFITLKDIQTLRKLYNDESIDNADLSGTPLSFPKLSIWAGIMMPVKYRIFANEELTNGIAYLFDLKEYPKSGYKAFELANECLHSISEQLNHTFLDEQEGLIQLIYGDSEKIKDVDKVWIVQDFILYLNRRVLAPKINYYWVNQGKNYGIEKEHNCIAATVKGLYHHEKLKDLQEGDILIHYVNSAIRATSVVIKEFEIKPRPYPSNEEKSIVVGVDYKVLESPVSLDFIKQTFENRKKILPKTHSPLNKNLGIVQSYCLNFNESSFNLLFKKKMNTKYWMYAPGERANMWNQFYEEGIIGLGWDDLGDLSNYNSKDELVVKLQSLYETEASKKNDATANYEFCSVMSPGDIVFVKKGRDVLLGYGEVISDYYFDDSRNSYKSYRKIKWIKKGNWNTIFNLPLKTLTDVTRYKTEDPRYEYYYERIMGIINGDKHVNYNMPLNTILYGPPGTGKTHKLLNYYLPQFQTINAIGSKEELINDIVEKYAWWEIITLCMLDLKTCKVDSIYNHELLQAKALISENKTPRNTIWAWLQRHTKEECEHVKLKKRDQPLIFTKDNQSVWSIDDEQTREVLPDLAEDFDNYKNYSPQTTTVDRFETVTFHQSYSYEDFVEGIKPIMDQEQTNGELNYTIENGIFKRLCIKARKDQSNKYAIFIDEINRGNVASIFGELITLIEQDKREGANNAMNITLPYSKTKFSIPPNLHIIGTMNTADRSVEALDTALRRRFAFEEVLPNPNIIKEFGTSTGIIENIDLETVLSKINERIEVLIDRDHTIGHSYFMNASTLSDLKLVFKDKIIPLLQEYFYGDYGKIGMVLGAGFIEKNKDQVIFASFNGYDTSMYEQHERFRLITIDENFDIKSAINLLLNKESNIV